MTKPATAAPWQQTPTSGTEDPHERPCCAKSKECVANSTNTKKCGTDGLGWYPEYSFATDACPLWSPSLPPSRPPVAPPPPIPPTQCRYDQELVQLETAMGHIHKQRGIVIYMQQEGRGIGLANKIAAYAVQELGLDTVDANRVL